MNIREKFLTLVITGVVALGLFVPVTFAQTTYISGKDNENSGKMLSTVMTDSEEVSKPGDWDGIGKAKVRVNPEEGQLCVEMWVINIGTVTAAHIHEAPKGMVGSAVIGLPIADAEGKINGCVSADNNKLRQIKENPENFYINVTTAQYPNGSIRGQL